jgi:hypothetical protein
MFVISGNDPLNTLSAEGLKKMQTFTSNVQKLICHDKIDYVNLRSWMTRYHFEDI